MSESRAGWEPIKWFGLTLRIFGKTVWYHSGKEEYAIDRNGQLVPLGEDEQEALDTILVDEEAVRRLDEAGKPIPETS